MTPRIWIAIKQANQIGQLFFPLIIILESDTTNAVLRILDDASNILGQPPAVSTPSAAIVTRLKQQSFH